ncbi:kelch repeat-containing 1, putative [Babesia ovata]|uniref:Kelch repeat-containing 1, putative n=1 Tax=Babesia ovata TaxID=189622 RepID=A0A2H6KA02_9APIC|nr:kelch repeat-containing 1, putative [Babesia ovata]GBE59779.1 kelch repeat-containing 1, putative [Babesia ovata]
MEESSVTMSTEEKYKELKRKYVTLKDAVKQLHDDYERVKEELVAKTDACECLEEQNQNLKKAYDELTDEVSNIKSREPAKSAPFKWENALTLIKKGAHAASNAPAEDVSLLYSEIDSLKTQLEAAAHEKEELLKEQNVLRTEKDSQGFEYSATVAKLKERIFALEGILKELQESLTTSESKSSNYATEIAELKSTVASRNSKLEKLEDTLSSDRKFLHRYVNLLETRLRSKVTYDLRRLPLINTFNVYHHQHLHNWSLVRHAVDDLSVSLLLSLKGVFGAWKSAMRFIRGSDVVTESVLQRSPPRGAVDTGDAAKPSASRSSDPSSSNQRHANEGEASDSKGDAAGESPDVVELEPKNKAAHSDENNSPKEEHPPATEALFPFALDKEDSNKHIWSAMESYRQMSVATISDLVLSIDRLLEGEHLPAAAFRRSVRLVRTLSRHLRLYLCLEEYLSPYEDFEAVVMGPRRMRQGTVVFIRCLRELCNALSRLFTIYGCALSRVDELSKDELSELANILSAEVGERTSSESDRARVSSDAIGATARNMDYSSGHSMHSDTGITDDNVLGPGSDDASTLSGVKYSERLRSLTDELSSSRPLRSLERRLFSGLKEVLGIVSVFKSVMSHRLCYPKMLDGFFFPLSGGSPEMVDLGAAIADFETNISRVTEHIVSLRLHGALQMRRNSVCCAQMESASAVTSETASTAKPSIMSKHVVPQFVGAVNAQLLTSPNRVCISTVSDRIRMAEDERREMSTCNERLSAMNEELMAARARCDALESRLAESYGLSLKEERLVSEFERLFSRYHYHDKQLSMGGVAMHSHHSDLLTELHALREDSGQKMKKLAVYVRHLVKSVEQLEDSNRQLRRALSLHAEQYAESKAAAESVHLNYNEQIALMSEHISELNNSIVQAEYRVSELSDAMITCPACRAKCSLGMLLH